MDLHATTQKSATGKRKKPAPRDEQFEQFAKSVRQRAEPADAETLFNAAVRALMRKR
jgi:hypothetical protein